MIGWNTPRARRDQLWMHQTQPTKKKKISIAHENSSHLRTFPRRSRSMRSTRSTSGGGSALEASSIFFFLKSNPASVSSSFLVVGGPRPPDTGAVVHEWAPREAKVQDWIAARRVRKVPGAPPCPRRLSRADLLCDCFICYFALLALHHRCYHHRLGKKKKRTTTTPPKTARK